MADVIVFVSYSWRIAASVKVVDDLEIPANERSIELLRDKKEIKLGEYISEFMQKIANAKQVIVVLSKPYFESEYCLWELLELHRKRRDEQTIYPILVDDINLSDSSHIIEFWKSERDKLQKEVDNDGAGHVPDKVERLNLFIDLANTVDRLMRWVGGILSEQANAVGKNDFSHLLDMVASNAGVNRQTKSLTFKLEPNKNEGSLENYLAQIEDLFVRARYEDAYRDFAKLCSDYPSYQNQANMLLTRYNDYQNQLISGLISHQNTFKLEIAVAFQTCLQQFKHEHLTSE